ncbi:MAG: hypothetical protein WBA05_19145 [Gordonia sp. (in: high G+C Gram-positive bacteria)]|uniref:hypothetical protein n=1 Tax=Gordonia TaxID=2053 RepID=UPI003263F0A3
MKKTLTTAIAVMLTLVAAIGVSVVGAGTAEAKWRPTPMYYNIYGNEIWAGGDCRGSMGIGIRNDPAKPGKIQVTARSHGFVKDGCTVGLKVYWINGAFPLGGERHFKIRSSRKAGKLLLQKEIWIGSGLALVGVGNIYALQKPISGYIWIP